MCTRRARNQWRSQKLRFVVVFAAVLCCLLCNRSCINQSRFEQGFVVESVAWNSAHGDELSTNKILLGSTKGLIYEALIEDKDRHCKKVYDLNEPDSKEPTPISELLCLHLVAATCIAHRALLAFALRCSCRRIAH